MNFQAVLALLVTGCVSVAWSAQCDDARNNLILNGIDDSDFGIACIDPCDVTGQTFGNESACAEQGFCHWNGTGCFLKTVKVQNVSQSSNLTDTLLTQLNKRSNSTDVEERNFVIGGGGPFFPNQCPKFPFSCNINPFSPDLYRLLDPPVNIPYCQRIPCKSSDPTLDSNGAGCHSNPGCFFDWRLHNLRIVFGQSILPGVPVCHLVIRNAKFHELVEDFTQKSKFLWNGLYTNCLIAENTKEIFSAPAGCYMNEMLRYMGGSPTLLGWEGITKADCLLIGGCYEGIQCVYPVKPKAVQIKSGEDQFRHFRPPPISIFGQPLCQRYNVNASAEEYLAAYHRGKQSGCVVEQWMDARAKENLLSVTIKYLPKRMRLGFWFLVDTGLAGADNWKKMAEDLVHAPENFAEVFEGSYWTKFRRLFARILSQEDLGEYGSKLNAKQRFVLLNPKMAGQMVPSDLLNLQVTPSYSSWACPYVKHSLPGFHPLVGSVQGCCEHNPIYTPRHKIHTKSSGLAPYWGNWGPWGSCSESCGGGTRPSKRRCIKYKEGEVCEGDDTRLGVCNSGECPKWGQWGSWSRCSASCGGGKYFRTRECSERGGCQGNPRQTGVCMTSQCPRLSQWSRWNPCNATCGEGRQTRARKCTNHCSRSIVLSQGRICHDICGKVTEVARTKCRGFPACMFTVTYECRRRLSGGRIAEGYCGNFKRVRKTRCKHTFKCRFCQYFKNCQKIG